MSDGDFWFGQFRNMVQEIGNLRMQLEKNKKQQLYVRKIEMIKRVRSFIRGCEIQQCPDNYEELEIKLPSLLTIKEFVETLVNDCVTLE
jgi:hypothetical protein